MENAKANFNLYKDKKIENKVQTFGNNAQKSKRGELPTLTRGFCKSYRWIKWVRASESSFPVGRESPSARASSGTMEGGGDGSITLVICNGHFPLCLRAWSLVREAMGEKERERIKAADNGKLAWPPPRNPAEGVLSAPRIPREFVQRRWERERIEKIEKEIKENIDTLFTIY